MSSSLKKIPPVSSPILSFMNVSKNTFQRCCTGTVHEVAKGPVLYAAALFQNVIAYLLSMVVNGDTAPTFEDNVASTTLMSRFMILPVKQPSRYTLLDTRNLP